MERKLPLKTWKWPVLLKCVVILKEQLLEVQSFVLHFYFYLYLYFEKGQSLLKFWEGKLVDSEKIAELFIWFTYLTVMSTHKAGGFVD